MNKHLDILTKLMIWYWDKDLSEFLAWIKLSSPDKKQYIKYYIYNRLK